MIVWGDRESEEKHVLVKDLRDELYRYDDNAQIILVTPDSIGVPKTSNIIGIYGGKSYEKHQIILVGDREEKSA